jgi:hypothetical protein
VHEPHEAQREGPAREDRELQGHGEDVRVGEREAAVRAEAAEPPVGREVALRRGDAGRVCGDGRDRSPLGDERGAAPEEGPGVGGPDRGKTPEPEGVPLLPRSGPPRYRPRRYGRTFFVTTPA